MASGHGILSYLKRLCFPPLCSVCRTLLDWRTPAQLREDGDAKLCPDCRRSWENETLETCGMCAGRVSECFCQTALMQRAGCEGLCKLTYYRPHQSAPPQNRMIFRIKRQNDRRTFLYLGEELVPVIRARLAEMQIPTESVILTHLPRMQRTVLRRGVDQAEELAKVLSELLAIPHRKLILRNHHSDREQKGLSAAEREKNAKRAFLPSRREDCRGRTVLLIDDVVTTGAGMAAGTRLLRRMKAERVIAVTVATDASNRDADGARV